jgi:hypothetical protein
LILDKETSMKTFEQLQTIGYRSTVSILMCALSLGLCAATSVAHAQPPAASPGSTAAVIYPAKGQSPRQQDQDKYECYDWARGKSGFDPAQASPPAASSPSSQSKATTGAMVRGALGGAAVGELANHDAGRGAAIGALGGGMLEQVRQRQVAQASPQQAAQQQAARSQQRATYDRAFGACMEARGYVVR